MFNSFKLIDGIQVTSGVSNSFTTDWVDIRNYSAFSFSTVFTGGSPQGTLRLQASNDRQFTGGQKVLPLYAAGAENSDGAIKSVSDAVNVSQFDPFGGWGQNEVTVAGAGTYVVEHMLPTFGWARLVYTASSNVNSQIDVFATIKSFQY